jgi:hypothetical protein
LTLEWWMTRPKVTLQCEWDASEAANVVDADAMVDAMSMQTTACTL